MLAPHRDIKIIQDMESLKHCLKAGFQDRSRSLEKCSTDKPGRRRKITGKTKHTAPMPQGFEGLLA